MKARRFSKVLDPNWLPDNLSDPSPSIPDDAWIKYDVDAYWEKLAEMDFETQQIREMAGRRFWSITLPHMNLEPAQQSEFWKGFFTGDAEIGREKAILGLTAFNRTFEAELVEAAKAAWLHDMPSDRGDVARLHCDGEGIQWNIPRLGEEFVRMIADPSYRPGAFKRIFELLENTDGNSVQKVKAAAPAWRGFCRYVIRERKLPTLLQFKLDAGLANSGHRDQTGNKLKRMLGLTGLPKN